MKNNNNLTDDFNNLECLIEKTKNHVELNKELQALCSALRLEVEKIEDRNSDSVLSKKQIQTVIYAHSDLIKAVYSTNLNEDAKENAIQEYNAKMQSIATPKSQNNAKPDLKGIALGVGLAAPFWLGEKISSLSEPISLLTPFKIVANIASLAKTVVIDAPVAIVNHTTSAIKNAVNPSLFKNNGITMFSNHMLSAIREEQQLQKYMERRHFNMMS